MLRVALGGAVRAVPAVRAGRRPPRLRRRRRRRVPAERRRARAPARRRPASASRAARASSRTRSTRGTRCASRASRAPPASTAPTAAGARAGECTACPTGTHKTEGLAGSAWDTKCDRCEPCPAGKKRVGCGLESAGTCDDCEAGTYKDGAYFWDFGSAGANSGLPLDQAAKLGRLAAPTKSGGECSRCMPCPPGSYLDGCGGASAGSCVQCPAGEFKPEGLEEGPSGWDTACTPLAACPAGQYRLGFAGLGTTYAGVAAVVGSSTDGQCVDCPAGTYKDAAGSWDTPCVAARRATPASTARAATARRGGERRVACPDGMYKTDSHSGLCVDCQPCVAGAYCLPPSTA